MAFTGVGGLSFGVEIELNFWFKNGTSPSHYHQDGAILSPEEDSMLPPALTHLRDETVWKATWAGSLLKDAILSVEGAKMKDEPMLSGKPDTLNWIRVVDVDGWTIKQDGSVVDDSRILEGYDYAPFEITSPALWDVPDSLNHVMEVLQALTSRFRLRVNPDTGFHCHVGAGIKGLGEGGKKKHSLHVLKRAAALTWAADGFLCHAHPPERGINIWAGPIRQCSSLAHGVKAPSNRWYPWPLNQPLSEDSAMSIHDMELLMQKSDDAGRRNFIRLHKELFPALRPHQPDEEAQKRCDPGRRKYDDDPEPANAIKTVSQGVSYIMNCTTRKQVGGLLSPAPGQISTRLNYNFNKYRSGRDARDTFTVEFREAAGSVDGIWIAYWANICLGIFRFARAASDKRFWAVTSNLSKAEAAAMANEPHSYDMISFLNDLGLFAEALYLERSLRRDQLGFCPICAGPRAKEPLFDGVPA
ncbi:hypothetical protein N656DRAFT_845721 [Canariomyces notabilis]|uniref:Amidoligase enzyme n=1 Tax=Canariomyces notabilis TaxID=2074819 RepID=A0AAN6TCL9_9PEZI|nr:hypothetical protein N656DRAFT_845721 [Canariomyces arenarius]